MRTQNFKTSGSGLNRFFGPLEAKIMDCLWDFETESTIKEVLRKLEQEKAMSFNTVMTVMNRLVEKGILRKRSVSKSFVYSPVMTRDEFMDSKSKELAFDLVEEFGPLAVTHMVDALEKADPKLLEQLEKQIKELKKER
jgi:predicted transcriptional regulator